MRHSLHTPLRMRHRHACADRDDQKHSRRINATPRINRKVRRMLHPAEIASHLIDLQTKQDSDEQTFEGLCLLVWWCDIWHERTFGTRLLEEDPTWTFVPAFWDTGLCPVYDMPTHLVKNPQPIASNQIMRTLIAVSNTCWVGQTENTFTEALRAVCEHTSPQNGIDDLMKLYDALEGTREAQMKWMVPIYGPPESVGPNSYHPTSTL